MKRVSAYLLFLMLTASAVASGSDDAGTESPFAFGAGARDLSLGGSALAFSDATTAPFWNPSRLARAGYYSLSGFHT